MNDNPFASPETIDANVKPDALTLPRRRPCAMLFWGISLGGMIGATAGGLTSGTIGFVAGLVDDTDRIGSLSIVEFSAALGVFQGGWMGVVIVGIVGLSCGILTPLEPAIPKWIGAILSAGGGGYFGFVAGHIVAHHPWAPIAGGIFGAAAGLIAGAFLGRIICSHAVRLRRAAIGRKQCSL